jgi:hypothetical protein
MVNLLIAMGLNICGTPEACHPMWGDFRRALRLSGLQEAMLKGSAVVNFLHGPFLSGAKGEAITEAMEHVHDTAGADYFDDRRESIAFDKGVPHDSNQVPNNLDDWQLYRLTATPKYAQALTFLWCATLSFGGAVPISLHCCCSLA